MEAIATRLKAITTSSKKLVGTKAIAISLEAIATSSKKLVGAKAIAIRLEAIATSSKKLLGGGHRYLSPRPAWRIHPPENAPVVPADSTGVTDRVVNQMLCYLDGVSWVHSEVWIGRHSWDSAFIEKRVQDGSKPKKSCASRWII